MKKLTTKQKGDRIENYIKDSIKEKNRYSSKKLSVFTPEPDDDGIDIIVNLKGDCKPFYIQIKSRWYRIKEGKKIRNRVINIRSKTLKKNDLMYYFFLYIDPFEREPFVVDRAYFVPSKSAEFGKILKHYKGKKQIRFLSSFKFVDIKKFEIKIDNLHKVFLKEIESIYGKN